MRGKIKSAADTFMFAFVFVQAVRGWYWLGREWILAANEARARRNR